jgi:hypothetical protein
MRRFAWENGLSLFFATIFLATLAGQSFAGQHNFNAEQPAHGQQTHSWWHYVVTPSFGGAVTRGQGSWARWPSIAATLFIALQFSTLTSVAIILILAQKYRGLVCATHAADPARELTATGAASQMKSKSTLG